MGVRYNSSVVTDGLVGYWDAANLKSYPGSGTTWFDLTRSTNNGTLVNSPTFNSNNSGSIVCNGTNQYINFGNVLDLTGEITLQVWVRSSTTTSLGRIVAKGTYGGPQAGYSLQLYPSTSGKASFIIGSGGTEGIILSDISITDGTWKHIVGIRNSTNTMMMYVNGVRQGQTAVKSGSMSNIYSLAFFASNTDALREYFNGQIAMVSIYNRALSQEEVLQNFNSTKRRFSNDSQPRTYYLPRAFSPDNLQIYYDPFNSGSYPGSGTTLFDLSGNGYNATLVNSPTISASNGITYNPASSQDVYVNQAFDHAYTKTITVNAWFKTTSTSRKIMGTELNATGTGSAGYDNLLYIDSNGKVRWGVYNGVVNTVVSTNSYNDGNWHLATGYQNNATGRSGLYVDGVYIGDMAAITTQPSNYYWRFGGYKMNSWTNTSDNWFSGSIGQVAIYTAVQSAGQILANYNTTKSRYGL